MGNHCASLRAGWAGGSRFARFCLSRTHARSRLFRHRNQEMGWRLETHGANVRSLTGFHGLEWGPMAWNGAVGSPLQSDGCLWGPLRSKEAPMWPLVPPGSSWVSLGPPWFPMGPPGSPCSPWALWVPLGRIGSPMGHSGPVPLGPLRPLGAPRDSRGPLGPLSPYCEPLIRSPIMGP